MTSDELNELLRRNPALSLGCAGPIAEPQRAPSNAALGKAQAKGGTSQRFLVRVTSVRKRLLDEDNLVSKYHTDLCRYAGVIPGDQAGICKIETTQRKAEKGEEEVVIVEVFDL
jgi:hypothetical protein